MRLKANGRGIHQLLGIVIVSSALAGCGGSSSDSSSSDTASSSVTAPTSTTGNGVAQVALSSSAYAVDPSSSAIVTIYRSGSSAGAATVGYSTINGSATAGADYVATSGSVSWQDGDTSAKTVVVPVTSAAGGKNFAIGLTNVQGEASFGSPASAVIEVAAAESVAAASSSGGSSSSSGAVASNSGTGSSSSGATSSSSGTTSSTGTKTASLSWSAPVENTNGTALTNLAGYRIYYGISTAAMTNKISVNTVGIQTYVIDNMTSGKWYFAVTSVNGAGVESALSSTVLSTL